MKLRRTEAIRNAYEWFRGQQRIGTAGSGFA